MKNVLLRCLSGAALLAVAGAPVGAGVTPEEATTGRALLGRYADVVIGVELVTVLKGTVNNRPLAQERKVDANGTVISASGLTVVSLGSIDPRAVFPAPPNSTIEEPEFKEVKLITADGTEYPARVVLKDEDLDLAFIAPVVPAEGSTPPFAHVRLDEPATAEILGNYFDISRASKKVERVPAVRVVNVIAILPKPRQMLLATDYSFGSPVFDREGRILGISVRQIVDGRSVGSVIIPAAEVAALIPEK